LIGLALMGLVDDLFVEDLDGADHEEAQVADDVIGEGGIGNIVAVNIKAEVLALEAAAVGELEFKVELNAFGHGRTFKMMKDE
jgi:hypothetical protein